MAETMVFTPSEVVILNGERFAPSASVLNKYTVYASGQGVNANKLAVAAWSAALLANEQYGLIRLTPSVNSTLFGLVKTPTLLVEPTGADTYVVVKTAVGLMTVRAPANTKVQLGEIVGMTVSGRHNNWFDHASGVRLKEMDGLHAA